MSFFHKKATQNEFDIQFHKSLDPEGNPIFYGYWLKNWTKP